jgi:hypothetical protein
LLLLLVLTCKIVLVFLVLGFAGSLLLQRRWGLGAVLAIEALLWFAWVGGWLMPAFGGTRASLWRQASKFGLRGVGAPNLMGSSVGDGAWTIARQLFSMANLGYIILLILPVVYLVLHRRRLALMGRLLPAAPLVLLNLAGVISPMKDLAHHYSLMLVPFMADSVMATLAPGVSGVNAYPRWFRDKAPSLVLAWAVLSFVAFSRLPFHFGQFQDRVTALTAKREVAAMVSADSRLLTNNNLAPHFSHRRWIELAGAGTAPLDLGRFDQVLLDDRASGLNVKPELVQEIRARLGSSKQWSLRFDRDGVWLFERRLSGSD